MGIFSQCQLFCLQRAEVRAFPRGSGFDLGVFGGVFRKHVSFFATNQSYQITNHYQPANRLLLYETILLLLL